jgi:uncharacterized protein (TIGR03067 family)
MRWQALVVVGLACGWLSAAPQDDKAVQEQLKKLEGEWTYASLTFAGKTLPDELTKTMILSFKDGKYTSKLLGQVVDEGTIKLIAPEKDKPWRWERTSGKLKDFTVKGIFKWDGDSVQYCESPVGQDAPKEFESKEGSLVNLATLKKK